MLKGSKGQKWPICMKKMSILVINMSYKMIEGLTENGPRFQL